MGSFIFEAMCWQCSRSLQCMGSCKFERGKLITSALEIFTMRTNGRVLIKKKKNTKKSRGSVYQRCELGGQLNFYICIFLCTIE